MTSARDLLRTYVRYAEWANNTMLAVCAQLSRSELERDLGASHSSLLSTLRHTYLSDRAWRDRVLAGRLPSLTHMAAPEPYSGATLGFGVDELQQRWQEISQSLLSWLDTVTNVDLDLEMPCLLPSGDSLRPTRAEILLHDLNHSTLHRGQIILMLRALGAQPPNLDVFSYYMHRH